MPRRNTLRLDRADSYYHVYVRGSNRQKIFRDETDYITFLTYLERYLAPEEARDKYGAIYPNYFNKVDMLAYCLLPTHFHFLVYQRQPAQLSALMRSLMTSYSRYFNARHARSGPLFESRYRSSLITDIAYLEHVTRFIHLQPKSWREYEYSSLPYYLQQDQVSWVRPEKVISLFATPADYLAFMADFDENKKMIDILKKELASEL